MTTPGLALDDEQTAARLEHPQTLGDAEIAVFPVVERMDRPDAIEGSIGERQFLGTSSNKLDVLERPRPAPCDGDHRLAAIDSDRSSDRPCRCPHGDTRAATHVEYGMCRLEIGDRDEPSVRLRVATEERIDLALHPRPR